jgi:hypothetical protein
MRRPLFKWLRNVKDQQQMSVTTATQILEIQDLTRRMRTVAQAVGPMHSYWDQIFDMECFMRGRKMLVPMTADEIIRAARRTLGVGC